LFGIPLVAGKFLIQVPVQTLPKIAGRVLSGYPQGGSKEQQPEEYETGFLHQGT